MPKYVIQVLIGFDQFCNTVLAGYADETLSSRAWRAEQKNKTFGKIFRPTIDCLLFFDRDHCYNSYLAEVERRQLPRDFRD